ncbi:MAG TPA: right-handed parallel beta-helix repeat-containing protein [Kofleriaceae bacterium]
MVSRFQAVLSSLIAVGCVAPYEDGEVGSTEQAARAGDECVRALHVPSASFPTIQSALDAAPNSGTICLAPITFYEDLTVTRSVTLRRTDATERGTPEIQPALDRTSAPAIISVGMNVSLSIIEVDLRFGLGGIRNNTLFAEVGDEPPTVQLTRVKIASSGPNGGISGRLNLKARQLTVIGSQGHGVDVWGSADVYQATASQNARVGIKIRDAHGLPFGWTRRLTKVDAANNGEAGAVVRNAGYAIERADFTANFGFGVVLENADGSSVTTSTLSSTQAFEGALWGVAINIIKSSGVTVHSNDLFSNALAGVAIFGCSDHPAHAVLSNNALTDNALHLISSAWLGCEDPGDQPSQLSDGGGNTCINPNSCAIVGASPSVPVP